MEKAHSESATRNHRTICVPFCQDTYRAVLQEAPDFRSYLDQTIELFPELFPAEICKGYKMKDIYRSKKQDFSTRRIEIGGTAYTIRPSFLMPYLTGITDQVEKAMFLRKFNVPFWALSHVFGKNPMYWHRIEQTIGRNSIVGTTVRNPDDIPYHLAADEKHSWICGEKTYVATTVGNECILGASIAQDAGEHALTASYGVFKHEARCLNPTYSPATVNIDGWKATRKAWSFLFSSIVIIYCFLHVYIKMRDRAKKRYKEMFLDVATKLWDCYKAEKKGEFSQRIRRLVEWCRLNQAPDVLIKPIEKLRKNRAFYAAAYDHPQAHRTSNMLDRLMQRMDRHLFSIQYFHGSIHAGELSIRGWALINNFAPSNPQTVKKHNGFQSPAERLNGFHYHPNWLHNLQISASLGGYRSPPQNPLQ